MSMDKVQLKYEECPQCGTVGLWKERHRNGSLTFSCVKCGYILNYRDDHYPHHKERDRNKRQQEYSGMSGKTIKIFGKKYKVK